MSFINLPNLAYKLLTIMSICIIYGRWSFSQCLIVIILNGHSTTWRLLSRAFLIFFLIHFAVTALRVIKRSLTDPMRNLSNWEKGDPCNSNWTGITCFERSHEDGHFHVRELYVSLVLTFVTFHLLRLLQR